MENRSELWSELIYFVLLCRRQQQLNNIQIRKYINKDETKYAIIPDNLDAISECNIVSLGIGNDILAEKQMQRVMPWCRFFGADPVDYRVQSILHNLIDTRIKIA
jgi:hypothetical protein